MFPAFAARPVRLRLGFGLTIVVDENGASSKMSIILQNLMPSCIALDAELDRMKESNHKDEPAEPGGVGCTLMSRIKRYYPLYQKYYPV